jgi:molecular chaperone GrpE
MTVAKDNEKAKNPSSADDARAAAFDALDDRDSGGDEGQMMQDELERIRGELTEAQDRTLRVQAELENYRRRSRREMEDERKYANLPLLRDLLPVVDNIQRAIQAAEKAGEAGTLLDGIKMVAQTLENALARHQATKIDALHKPFDPAVHEAISQQPSADYPEHTVLLVAQDGYLLHDRVVRPAQVIVSTAPAS